MVGRKPTPLGIKIVTGNPGKRPLPEPGPQPQGTVKKPPFVKGLAAKLWKQYVAELERLKLLTGIDCDMFGVWCCLMAEFQEAPRNFNASKITQMRALASSFGLDPSTRTRLGTPVPKKAIEENKAQKYFAS